MDAKHILQEIQENLEEVILQESELGRTLFRELLDLHAADIATLLEDIDRDDCERLFLRLPRDIKTEVFVELPESLKIFTLSFMEERDQVDALNALESDQLTDLFDRCSDEELKRYLDLLHTKSREDLVARMKFPPESAGGIMDTQVVSLRDDFTVEKSVKLLQRIQLRREIHQQIYVTDSAGRLVGYINLEDLVFNEPQRRISEFMQESELTVRADEDREKVARDMVHYGVTSVPVINNEGYFLGTIPSDTLVDVIVEESSEDVQKMAALTPMKYSYFETSFWRMFYERGYILIILLLVESLSSTIVRSYEAILGVILMSFLPMLVNAGGSASNQSSAILIQGMASGDIRSSNVGRFVWREFLMAASLALILGIVTFVRVYFVAGVVLKSFAVSLSLATIVVLSMVLGSTIPLILRRLNIDPAFAAGPFLATIMDIIGIFIFCYISGMILS